MRYRHVNVLALNQVDVKTFVEVVSEVDVVNSVHYTDKPEDEEAIRLKPDFGRIHVDDTLIAILFGNNIERLHTYLEKTPDLLDGINGFILLFNSSKQENPSEFIKRNKALLQEIQGFNKPYVIAANYHKGVESYSLEELHQMLAIPDNIPLLFCDPVTEPQSAKNVLIELFKLMPQDELLSKAIEYLKE